MSDSSKMSTVATIQPPFKKVDVIGLGLIGGSFARALRKSWPNITIRGWSLEDAELEAAESLGVIDEKMQLEELATLALDTDLVVFATPHTATAALIKAHGGAFPEKTVIMDLASLKLEIEGEIRGAGLSDRWVGAHPMSGKEVSGFTNSEAELFTGGFAWLVDAGTTTQIRERVEALWTALAVRFEWVDDARRHDLAMEMISHVPHIVSIALAELYALGGVSLEELGSGGQAMSRLAGSDPGMWRDIFAAASSDLPESLRRVGDHLHEYAALFDAGKGAEVADRLLRTRAWRDASLQADAMDSGEDA